VTTSSPGSTTNASDTGSPTDRGSTRGARRNERKLSTCWPGGKADAFVTTASTLAGQGDLALALEILAPGLLRHPDSGELAELRQAVVVQLMEQRQLLDPFGFVVYAQVTGTELSPFG